MTIPCPCCEEREFSIDKMLPIKTFSRSTQKAIYKCKACGYKEVIG
jgi:C4-type Zn-finger protein